MGRFMEGVKNDDEFFFLCRAVFAAVIIVVAKALYLSNDDDDGSDNATKKIGLMVHFFAVSAKQQRETNKFKVLWRTWGHESEFFILFFNSNATPTNLVPV